MKFCTKLFLYKVLIVCSFLLGVGWSEHVGSDFGTTSLPTVSQLSILVEAGGEECFFEHLNKGDQLDIQFQVTRGHGFDIDFVFRAPAIEENFLSSSNIFNIGRNRGQHASEQVIFRKRKEFNIERYGSNPDAVIREGSYQHRALQPGDYQICFDNRFSSYPKHIMFNIRDIKDSPSQLYRGHIAPAVSKADTFPLKLNVMSILHRLNSMQQLLQHQRLREEIHRDTAESTNTRVLYSFIFEAIALGAIAFYQLCIIRSWFNSSAKLRSRV